MNTIQRLRLICSLLVALLTTVLAGCTNNQNPPPLPPPASSPWAGTWVGQVTDRVLGQTGTITLNIDRSGVITGQTLNKTMNVASTLTNGSVADEGSFQFNYTYDGIPYTCIGSLKSRTCNWYCYGRPFGEHDVYVSFQRE